MDNARARRSDNAITVYRTDEVTAPERRSDAVAQADDDAHLVRLWLHGKSANTRDAYERDVRAFVDFADAPLARLTLQHVQDWTDVLAEAGLAASTRARKLSAVKSLLSFGHRLGYLIYNVGAAVSPPKTKDTLAERILPEAAVHRVLSPTRWPLEPCGSRVVRSAPQRARAPALLRERRSGLRDSLGSAGGTVSSATPSAADPPARSRSSARVARRAGCSCRPTRGPSSTDTASGKRPEGHAEADGPVLRSRKADADGVGPPH